MTKRKCLDCQKPANGYTLMANGQRIYRCDEHHRKAWEIRKAGGTRAKG